MQVIMTSHVKHLVCCMKVRRWTMTSIEGVICQPVANIEHQLILMTVLIALKFCINICSQIYIYIYIYSWITMQLSWFLSSRVHYFLTYKIMSALPFMVFGFVRILYEVFQLFTILVCIYMTGVFVYIFYEL